MRSAGIPQASSYLRVELHEILVARQAFALGFDGKRVGYLVAHALRRNPVPNPGTCESLTVQFLAGVAVKAVTAQEIRIAMV